MHRPVRLTDLQVDLAAVFFALDAVEGYLVAGGAALRSADPAARVLTDRPCQGPGACSLSARWPALTSRAWLIVH